MTKHIRTAIVTFRVGSFYADSPAPHMTRVRYTNGRTLNTDILYSTGSRSSYRRVLFK